jgi:HAD superfamily hydrolase (TIGR01509 family)
MGAEPAKLAIVDVDGTLVDSVYQHALTWHRAFAEADLAIPVWRCHRAIGMGGDQLVPELAGDEVERDRGERLREREGELFAQLLDEVQPLPGASDLIEALAERGLVIVLASSAATDEVREHISTLGIEELIAGFTSADDVDASKPDPDLVEAALAKAREHEDGEAVMIGDSVWDVRAAERAGIGTIGLLTGGFSADELHEAGATAVYADPGELAGALDEALAV